MDLATISQHYWCRHALELKWGIVWSRHSFSVHQCVLKYHWFCKRFQMHRLIRALFTRICDKDPFLTSHIRYGNGYTFREATLSKLFYFPSENDNTLNEKEFWSKFFSVRVGCFSEGIWCAGKKTESNKVVSHKVASIVKMAERLPRVSSSGIKPPYIKG